MNAVFCTVHEMKTSCRSTLGIGRHGGAFHAPCAVVNLTREIKSGIIKMFKKTDVVISRSFALKVHKDRADSAVYPDRFRNLERMATLVASVSLMLPLIVSSPSLATTETLLIDSRESQEHSVEDDYFETVPQGLTSDDDRDRKAPRLGSLMKGPHGSAIEQCTKKCVATCVRGGQGSPGLGPMSVRKEIIVFKDGYRSRSYCLSECVQVCSLTINSEKR